MKLLSLFISIQSIVLLLLFLNVHICAYTYVPGSLSFASPIPRDGSSIRMEGNRHIMTFANIAQTYRVQANYTVLSPSSSLPLVSPSSATYGWSSESYRFRWIFPSDFIASPSTLQPEIIKINEADCTNITYTNIIIKPNHTRQVLMIGAGNYATINITSSSSSSSSSSSQSDVSIIPHQNQARTFTFWAKPSHLNVPQAVVGMNRLVSGCDNYEFAIGFGREGESIFMTACNNDLSIGPASIGVIANTWYHITAVWNGGTREAQVYVNGVAGPKKRWRYPLTTSIERIILGGRATTTTGAGVEEPFTGELGEIHVYSRVLTETEIRRDMNAYQYAASMDTNATLGLGLTLVMGVVTESSTSYGVLLSSHSSTSTSTLGQASVMVDMRGTYVKNETLHDIILTVTCDINGWDKDRNKIWEHGRNKPLRVKFPNGQSIESTDVMEWKPPTIPTNINVRRASYDEGLEIAEQRIPPNTCSRVARDYNYYYFPYPQTKPNKLILPRTKQEFFVVSGIPDIPIEAAFVGQWGEADYQKNDDSVLVHFSLIPVDPARLHIPGFGFTSRLVLSNQQLRTCCGGRRYEYPVILHVDTSLLHQVPTSTGVRILNYLPNRPGEFHLTGPQVDVIQEITYLYGYEFKLVMLLGHIQEQAPIWQIPQLDTTWIIDTNITIAFQPPPRVDYIVGCATTEADRSRNVFGCETTGGQEITIIGDYFFSFVEARVVSFETVMDLTASINGHKVVIVDVDYDGGTWIIIETIPAQGSYLTIDIISNNIHTDLNAVGGAATISYALPTITHMETDACSPHITCQTSPANATCLKLDTCQRRMNGTQLLTIHGTNLGTVATVLVGAAPCRDVKLLIPHKKLQCILPDGNDQALSVTVTVAGLSSIVGPTLSYTQCQPGTYQIGLDCLNCPDGEYSDRSSQSSCTPAGSGQYVRADRRDVLPCAAGSYSNKMRAATCSPCPLGRYTAALGQSQCEVAEAGKYVNITGAISAKQCPRGTYQSTTEQSTCKQCEPGYRSEAEGQTQCIPCAAGTYTSTNGSITCIPCSKGTAAASPGQSTCIPCEPGYRNEAEAQTQCIPCPAGTYTNINGSITCTPCEKGKVAATPGSRTCIACEAGYRNEAEGQTQCIPCPAGTYTNTNGSITCSPCSKGTVTATPGLSTCKECPAGRYQDNEGEMLCNGCDDNGRQEYVILLPNGRHECRPCPSGTRCSSGIIIATDDVWLARQLDTSVESITCQPGKCVECPNPTTSASASVANYTNINIYNSNSTNTIVDGVDYSNKTSSSLIDLRPISSVAAVRFCCAEYREDAINNPLCGRCIPGYQEWGGRCVSCTSTNVGVLIGLVIASWLYVGVFIFICQSNDGLVNIFMYFAATAYLVIGPNTSALSWISFFQFGIFSSGAATCVAAISWRDKFILSLFSPLIAMGQLICIMCGYSIYRTILYRQNEGADRKFRWRVRPFFRTMIALLLFSFTQTAATVAKFLSCQQVTVQGVTDSYIISSPAISCTSDEYRSLLPLFIVMGLLLVIILPLSIFVYIRLHRDRLHDRHMLAIFGVAYETYHPDRYMYELAVLLRRAILVSLSVALVNDRVQMYTSMTIANIGILGIHVVVHPFKTKTENFLESLSLLTLCMISTVLDRNSSNTNNMSTGYMVLLTILVLGTGIILLSVMLYHKYQKLHHHRMEMEHVKRRLSIDMDVMKSQNEEMGVEMGAVDVDVDVDFKVNENNHQGVVPPQLASATGAAPVAILAASQSRKSISTYSTSSSTSSTSSTSDTDTAEAAVAPTTTEPRPAAVLGVPTATTTAPTATHFASSDMTSYPGVVTMLRSSSDGDTSFDPEHPFALR